MLTVVDCSDWFEVVELVTGLSSDLAVTVKMGPDVVLVSCEGFDFGIDEDDEDVD